MNKLLNIFLIVGLILFLFFALISYPVINFESSGSLRIEILLYNSVSIISCIGSIFFLSIALIGKFKNLPDLTDANLESNLLLDRDTIDY